MIKFSLGVFFTLLLSLIFSEVFEEILISLIIPPHLATHRIIATLRQMRRLSKTEVAIFPFVGFSVEELARTASSVLPPNSPKRAGKNEHRTQSHYAGRAALSAIFSQLRLHAVVAPHRTFGYLQVFDSEKKIIPDVFVNVSHTKELAVAVVSCTPVGVDVESSQRDASRVLTRVASEVEMKKVSEGQIKGIALWSAKEAFSKAVGLGIKFGLHQFQIEVNNDPLFSKASTSLKGPQLLSNPAIHWNIFEAFVIAICTEEKTLELGLNWRVLGRGDFPR